MRWWLAGVVALAGAGCSGKSGGGLGGGGEGNDPCTALKPKLERLYRAQDYGVAKDEGGAELADDLTQANIEMVLRDCRDAPEKVVACVASAADVATIEGKCLIPLDDEGNVEHNAFIED